MKRMMTVTIEPGTAAAALALTAPHGDCADDDGARAGEDEEKRPEELGEEPPRLERTGCPKSRARRKLELEQGAAFRRHPRPPPPCRNALRRRLGPLRRPRFASMTCS